MVVYAHTRPDLPPTEWEPLEAHAKAVAALACISHTPPVEGESLEAKI
jgi:hypothetical protein